jgi:hypothetical protein
MMDQPRPKSSKRVIIFLLVLTSLVIVAIIINCVASAWITYVIS